MSLGKLLKLYKKCVYNMYIIIRENFLIFSYHCHVIDIVQDQFHQFNIRLFIIPLIDHVHKKI